METAPKKIFSLIPKVMSDVGAIGKDGVNRDQNYKFRSIDDVYNKLQPALIKNGVFFVPEVIESKEEAGQTKSGTKNVRVKLRVKYVIYADDGSSINAVVEGEGIDTSDKATNKAMTAAFKYMLIQIFCIAVEGLDDADKEHPEMTIVQEKKPDPAKGKAPTKKTEAKPAKVTDMKIPEGKFKGKMLSSVPREHLAEYVEEIVQAMETSGRQPPKWFEELRKVSGL